jgi:hypothetical protein
MIPIGLGIAPSALSARSGIGSLLAGLVRRDSLLQIFQPELQLIGSQLLGAAAKPMPQQALDQHAEFVVLGVQFPVLIRRRGHRIPQHLLQQSRVVRQTVEVDLHRAMMINAVASVPAFPTGSAHFYPANAGRRRIAGARHSHPSSSATNCADVNAIRPAVLADGHWNWPCSSRFVSMQSPMPSCQISLISPDRRPRNAYTEPSNGFSNRLCCTSIANPTAPFLMSVTPQAR